MSLKRPLSPESNNDNFLNNNNNNNTRKLKRLKLHSIIQQLRNEETKLVLLKKLRTNQQLSSRINKNSSTLSNDNLSTKKISSTTTVPTKSVQPVINNTSLSQQQSAIRKTSNPPLVTTTLKQPTTTTTIQSYEERKNQAKSNLRKQLERDLLSIPPPKPTLQDITFVPNGSSLEFQPLIGLEDVVQCLAELQTDRQRLPQRFTDRAQIDQPFVCNQCGTDFTIRWWKHSNIKTSDENTNILCDRCKKQLLRRTAKSEHSTLLKNVFLSAMKQEKEIEKTFQILIKQEKTSAKTKSFVPSPTYTPSLPNPQYQMKNYVPPALSQATKKPNTNLSRTVQARSTISAPQHQMKNNSLGKISKHTIKSQGMLPTNHPIFPQHAELFNAFLASNLVKPTSSKRRTYPTIQFK